MRSFDAIMRQYGVFMQCVVPSVVREHVKEYGSLHSRLVPDSQLLGKLKGGSKHLYEIGELYLCGD